jgi:putative serine protease PepD
MGIEDLAGDRNARSWRSGRTRRWVQLVVACVAVGSCAACTTANQDSARETSSASSSAAVQSKTPSPPTARLGTGATDWSQVAKDVEPSVVSIFVRGQTSAGEGSGVILDDTGHVLTNNHVVAAAVSGGRMQVSLSDARVFDAALVGADPATDLAVIAIQSAPDDLVPMPVGNSEAVEVGQPVMAVGNPLGLSHTVTLGIVSALDRPVTTQAEGGSPTDQGVPVVTNAIQTDAAVNPGNSGGALVDAGGRLIGVNSSIAGLGSSDGGQSGSIGLGFAIPVNEARWVSNALIDDGRVRHAFLGVQPQDALVQIDGVRRQVAGIRQVIPDTPAARGGLRSGEAVAAVDGETVASAESLVAQIRERKPGTKVVLTVIDRSGSSRDVPVEFGTRPSG